MRRRRLFTPYWIGLLISAAAGCGGPLPAIRPPADAELDRSNSAARAAFDRGVLSEASILYDQSLARARVMDDPREVADAAYNLAACLVGLDELDRARHLLQEAEWDLDRVGGNTDDLILLEAEVARRQGKIAEAQSLTDRLISEPRTNGATGPVVGVYVLRGLLALERHDVTTANRELAAARVAFKDGTDLSISAGITGLSARIALEEKHPADAAQKFDAQAALLQRAALYSEMSWALSHAGDAYLAAGRPDLAADRLYRAARCAFALGNTVQARKLVDSASEAADAAKLSSISEPILGLKDEMSAATHPSATTLPSPSTEATKHE